ncbi:LOW QUALITY PROTEIN: cullin-9-like, partial [Syngnathus typhle]
RVLGKKTVLEKVGGVMDILKKEGPRRDPLQNLAGVIFIRWLLREKNSSRSDSVPSVQDKVVKLLVELLGSPCPNLVGCTLRLAHSLMRRHEWRVTFATKGGVKAVLTCMQEIADMPHVQQLVLVTLKVLMGACGSEVPMLSEAGAQMMLELFASLGSATPEGSKGPLAAIPAALDLMLRTPDCAMAVRDGLTLVVMLVSDHSLASQLVSCGITAVLEKCLALSQDEIMLAIVALNHILMAQKLENKGEHIAPKCAFAPPRGPPKKPFHPLCPSASPSDPPEQLQLKDIQLQKLPMSLKGMTATAKEVIHMLKQLLCQSASLPEGLRSQVSQSRDVFQDLLRLMKPLRADRNVQLSIFDLNKSLYSYQEDALPWHDSIKPCLASLSAFVTDKEVVQQLLLFLHRLTRVNIDYAVVMCRHGTKELLNKAQDKQDGALNAAGLSARPIVSLPLCHQMTLDQIEEHRRSREPINVPFFDVLLRNLCQGQNRKRKRELPQMKHCVDGCFVFLPSVFHHPKRLANTTKYNIFMHRGVVIRSLAILVANEDSSYMPAKILVLGGDNQGNISTELNMVNVTTSATRIVLLENMTRCWSIVQGRIKRCQQVRLVVAHIAWYLLRRTVKCFKNAFSLCHSLSGMHTLALSHCLSLWHSVCLSVSGTISLWQCLSRWHSLWHSPSVCVSLCLCVCLSLCISLSLSLAATSHTPVAGNSAFRHEQMFAERFLPDAEAAEALGRTSWEALVTPIVRAITLSGLSPPFLRGPSEERPMLGCVSSPEQGGPSPLSWLLDEYLAKSDSAPYRCKFRAAIFNSCVRRLTHLLVHADTRPERPGLPAKSQDKEAQNKESAAAPMRSRTSASCFCLLAAGLSRPSASWTSRRATCRTAIGGCFVSVLMSCAQRFCGPYDGVRVPLGQSVSFGSRGIPGGLQWTWLGHADVQFGCLTLHVSTLQMFILLQFNTQQEVGVAPLLNGPGLSKELVLHALQPLIDDEGPLNCSHPLDPCQGMLQPKWQAAPGPYKCVELQPPQTYLNVDKDATPALETKRNFIYCLIVNILKQEKMYIDNLVFKVAHYFSAGLPACQPLSHVSCAPQVLQYLSAGVEQNLVTNFNCPIPDGRGQATSRFFLSIVTDKDTVAKILNEKTRLRGFVESCSNLTWCTNPQGCDQILCKENMGSMSKCGGRCARKAGWIAVCLSDLQSPSPQAHCPASCSHMSQWIDDGGFYESMSADAQSKHLARLISKRCPNCQAQIEKNEGCLHMTCAKCNHGFCCWRCLKAWNPMHKDYYNCAAMVGHLNSPATHPCQYIFVKFQNQ